MQRVASLLGIKSHTDAGLGVLKFNRGQHRASDDIYFKLCHFTSLGAIDQGIQQFPDGYGPIFGHS